MNEQTLIVLVPDGLRAGDVILEVSEGGDPAGPRAVFVRRDVPDAPQLPTEPYTVIRVKWRKGGHTFLVLTPVGWQDIDGTALRSGGEPSLAALITGFEVLAEPRAVTAKAVLDRVRFWQPADPDDRTRVAREFGVSS